MNKKYLVLIIIFISPLFFIKSSNITFKENYEEIKISSSNALIIQNTVYSFKQIFNINVVAYGYKSKEFEFNHNDAEKLIILVEMPVLVKFKIDQNYNEFILNDRILDSLENIYLKKGIYSYEVKSKNHISYKSKLEINKYADEILVPIIMQEVNKKLVINSEPNQASVFLNNVELGVTPLSVNLNTTSNNILIKKSEYKDSNIDYIVKNNNSDQIIIKLIEDEDVININTVPSQASLFFNEDYIGISPLKFKIQDKGILKVKKYGYVDNKINITKDTKKLNIVLTEDSSEVFISSDPPSDVFLNEEYIGKTPFTKKIQKIKHKISFKSKGFRTLNESFEPTKDKQNIIKKLLTEKEASLLENKKYSRTSIDGEVILFEPGSFVMGSSKKESRRDINEIMRSVKITKHFYISKNLITEEQYSLFKRSSKSNLPVNNISWIDAAKFCNWLSSKEGFENFYEIKNNQIISFNMDSKGYRLPTEAEWEYVAKSNNPEKYIYSWGSDRKITKLVGNIADVSTQGILSNFIDDYDDGYDERSPVGSFRSNQNDINDLTGNLSEWVNDFYSVEFVQQSKVFQDYIGPLAGTSHVIKGSNYYSSTPLQLGLSYRTYGNEPNSLVGFRIARWIY
tara:strand:- start:4330 stop:6207 length:1878 start_codon:yes stop_codon:yes gene_type:complete